MYKLESLCIEKDKKYIEIFAEGKNPDDFHWFCTPVRIYFRDKQQRLLIRKAIIGSVLEDTRYELEDLLLGKHPIPQGLQEKGDIGLLASDFWQEVIQAERAGLPLPKWGWALGPLIVFHCDNNKHKSNKTFLYNDEQGNIVLQISTVYPWFFRDPEKDKDSVDYDTWRPTYKIIYKAIISKDVVRQWIVQLEALANFQRSRIGIPPLLG